MGDLLNESVEYMNRQFLDYMAQDTGAFVVKLRTCPPEELYLITPEYLTPYLRYIKEHKWLFRTATENAKVLGLFNAYEGMYRYVLTPILEGCHVPENKRVYLMQFYIHGLMAVIMEWLRNDCADPMELIISVMQQCVIPHVEET